MPGSVLAELIRTRRDELVETWEAGVRTLASAARQPGPALVDRVPAFLDWLADRLDAEEKRDAERDAFSHDHTVGRQSRGYDLVELIAEWTLLRDVLLAAWEGAPEGITPAEIRHLDLELDHVIAVSVVEYARALGAGAVSRGRP